MPDREPIMLKATSLLSLLLLTTIAAPAFAFTDTQGHWAERYIDALASRNILGGFPDGSFRPDQPVTRAQFAAIADKVFQVQNASNGGREFTDVPMNHWAYRAIREASSANLVTGYPDGTFHPEQSVTRGQALVVIAGGARLPQASPAVLERFQDSSTIPPWAVSSLASATQAGLVVNYPNDRILEPNRGATRGEVAAFLYRVANAGTPQIQPVQYSPYPPTRTFDAQVSTLQSGTVLVSRLQSEETLFVGPNERRGFTLVLDRPVRDSNGAQVLPEGAEILGNFVPVRGGTRFEANSVRLNGQVYSISARSQVLRDSKDPRETSIGAVAGDALIGGAAGAVIAGLTGDHVLATEKLLGGAAAGALIGNVTAPNVVVIEPDTALELVLKQDFRTY